MRIAAVRLLAKKAKEAKEPSPRETLDPPET